MTVCVEPWESLSGDPLSWLLDPQRPNLHWRVLLELVRRPADSPAVVRARGGSNVFEPVATLIADLQPDGSWATDQPLWRLYSGPGWRFLAAVQWGADPADPRLQAAAQRMLETAPGEGGFVSREGGRPAPWLTARLLHGLAELGWCRHPRFQEGLAWLEDGASKHPAGGWRIVGRGPSSAECAVTAAALLGTLTACADDRRGALGERAAQSLSRSLANTAKLRPRLGHPCLGRTDEAEILRALSRAAVPLEPEMVPALQRVQRLQCEGGRWRRGNPVPDSLGLRREEAVGAPSRWVTLKCVVALMTYAVEAKLPRMYPQKPSAAHPPSDQQPVSSEP